MEKCLWFLFFSSMLVSVCYGQTQNCSTYIFPNGNTYATCNTLPVLNSYLHWTYHQTNHTVDIAYRHTGITTSNWVVWALNLQRQGMLGSQCLIAFTNSTGGMSAYTTTVNSMSPDFQPRGLSFGVPRIEAQFVSSNGEMIIFATLQLPTGQTLFNQVWQYGPVTDGAPRGHETSGDNLRSTGTVDFVTGQTSSDSGSIDDTRRKRNTHGVLNAVSWGILMPIGAIVARYLKVFKSAHPAWFYLHVITQTSAYIVGVAGWGTGLKLGSDSQGITQNPHRNIGIALFCLGTLQVFALLLRPKPDHKYRFYWNIYHHSVGYTVIILSIINIFEGFDILDPEDKWKKAYTGIIIALGAIAVFLEAITWIIVLKRKKKSTSDKFSNGTGQHNNNGSQQAA